MNGASYLRSGLTAAGGESAQEAGHRLEARDLRADKRDVRPGGSGHLRRRARTAAVATRTRVGSQGQEDLPLIIRLGVAYSVVHPGRPRYRRPGPHQYHARAATTHGRGQRAVCRAARRPSPSRRPGAFAGVGTPPETERKGTGK